MAGRKLMMDGEARELLKAAMDSFLAYMGDPETAEAFKEAGLPYDPQDLKLKKHLRHLWGYEQWTDWTDALPPDAMSRDAEAWILTERRCDESDEREKALEDAKPLLEDLAAALTEALIEAAGDKSGVRAWPFAKSKPRTSWTPGAGAVAYPAAAIGLRMHMITQDDYEGYEDI